MKGFEKRRNDDLSAVFQLESAEIPEYKMEQQMRILDRGMRPTRSLQEPTNFSNEKLFLEGSKQI